MTKKRLTDEERRAKNREYSRRWRENHPDTLRERRKKYRNEHKETCNANYRRYYWLHHEEILAKAQAKRDAERASRPPRIKKPKEPKKPLTREQLVAKAEYMRRYRWTNRDNSPKADYSNDILKERKEKEKRYGKDYRAKVMERCKRLAGTL